MTYLLTQIILTRVTLLYEISEKLLFPIVGHTPYWDLEIIYGKIVLLFE